MKEGIDAAEVKRLLNYDPATGVFTRAVELRCGMYDAVVRYRPGDPAGTVGRAGYVQIGVLGKLYYAHRLAFAWMTGRWPEMVDHKNGLRADNRWDNLRETNARGNQQNRRRAEKRSLTGLLGVSPSFGKFEARIVVDGEQQRLGRFECPAEAHEAYVEAKRRLHPTCTI